MMLALMEIARLIFRLAGGTRIVIVRIPMDCTWRDTRIYMEKELSTLFG